MRTEGSSRAGHSPCSSLYAFCLLMHWKGSKGLPAKAFILRCYLILKMSPLAACGDWIIGIKRENIEIRLEAISNLGER